MGCCAAVGCSHRSEKGYKMFSFPFGKDDVKRRQIWITNVKRANWEPSRASKLCEVHFEPTQFERCRKDGLKKLKPNAIPTIFAHTVQRKKRKKPLEQSPVNNAEKDDEQMSPVTTHDHNYASATTPQEIIEPDSCELSMSHDTEFNDYLSCVTVNIQEVDSTVNVSSEDCSLISTKEASFADSLTSKDCEYLTEENAQLKNENAHLKYINDRIKKVNLLLRRQLKKSKNEYNSLAQNLNKLFTVDQQLALSKENQRGFTWSEQTIKKALQMKFMCGETGYHHLISQGFPLPSTRTLRRRISNDKSLIGILKEVSQFNETEITLNQENDISSIIIPSIVIESSPLIDSAS